MNLAPRGLDGSTLAPPSMPNEGLRSVSNKIIDIQAVIEAMVKQGILEITLVDPREKFVDDSQYLEGTGTIVDINKLPAIFQRIAREVANKFVILSIVLQRTAVEKVKDKFSLELKLLDPDNLADIKVCNDGFLRLYCILRSLTTEKILALIEEKTTPSGNQ